MLNAAYSLPDDPLHKMQLINPHMGPATIQRMKILSLLPQIKSTAEEARWQVEMHREASNRNPFPIGPN
jgi:hypothetical protein